MSVAREGQARVHAQRRSWTSRSQRFTRNRGDGTEVRVCIESCAAEVVGLAGNASRRACARKASVESDHDVFGARRYEILASSLLLGPVPKFGDQKFAR